MIQNLLFDRKPNKHYLFTANDNGTGTVTKQKTRPQQLLNSLTQP